MENIKNYTKTFTIKQNPIILMRFTGNNIDDIFDFIGEEFKIENVQDGIELKITNKNDSSKSCYYWFLIKGNYIRSVNSKYNPYMKILEIYSEKYISENFDEQI